MSEINFNGKTEETESKTTFLKKGALWKGRGKVSYRGIIEEDIKKGAKILLFFNEDATEENRQPVFRIVEPQDDQHD
jgi:hypothetical protein